MNRFLRTIDLSKSRFCKSEENPLTDLSASKQLAVLKIFKKKALVEGAIDELQRAQPVLDREYYVRRMLALQGQLQKLTTEKKATRVVELRFIG